VKNLRRVPCWPFPHPVLQLPDDEVHVWRATVDLPAPQQAILHETLSAEERERAAHFVCSVHRDRFAAARGILRDILSRYTKIPPQALAFRYGPGGKPAVLPGYGPEDLQFNISHSGELALYAVSWKRQLGIDVERIRESSSWEKIAERFFSPVETAALRNLLATERTATFFRYWTCKEAWAKAVGARLSWSLGAVDVAVEPARPATVLAVCGDTTATSKWSLVELPVGTDYAAALVVEGGGWKLVLWQWDGVRGFPHVGLSGAG